MTRLQKKCLLFSLSMHGLLLVVVVASSAFRSKPEPQEMQILTMLPANIVDRPGAGGGSPQPAVAQALPQPKPAPPVVQQPPPRPQPVQKPEPVAPTPKPEPSFIQRLFHPTPVKETPEPLPIDRSGESAPKSSRTRPPHEVVPTFDPVKPSRTRVKPTEETAESAEATARERARAEARRLRNIDSAMEKLARNVSRSGAAGTVVSMPGQGGGAAFVGYETYIYNRYYHAWTAPDSVANTAAATFVKIVVARDGSILSAEIMTPSGERSLDRSVERVLREVTKLPPFPAGATDDQRSFVIRFHLENKEGSG